MKAVLLQMVLGPHLENHSAREIRGNLYPNNAAPLWVTGEQGQGEHGALLTRCQGGSRGTEKA